MIREKVFEQQTQKKIYNTGVGMNHTFRLFSEKPKELQLKTKHSMTEGHMSDGSLQCVAEIDLRCYIKYQNLGQATTKNSGWILAVSSLFLYY